MKRLLTLFTIILYAKLTSYSQCNDFVPADTVFIGKNHPDKTVADYFDTTRHNVMVYIDEGVYYSGTYLYIDGENIKIEGIGDVHLYCTELYHNVMWIIGKNISVKNIHMKHFKPGSPISQNCSGRVVGFDNAHNVTIEGCDLNGCGLAGLHDNLGNSHVFIKDNYIHNNSLGAYTDINGGVWQEAIDDHPVFSFENNRIENNGMDRIRESDTLLVDMMDTCQLETFMHSVEPWRYNDYGVCKYMLKNLRDEIDILLEDIEVVGHVNESGKFEVIEFMSENIETLSVDDTKEILDCFIEGLEENLDFEECLHMRFIRFKLEPF